MRLSEVSRPRVGVYPYGPHGPGAAQPEAQRRPLKKQRGVTSRRSRARNGARSDPALSRWRSRGRRGRRRWWLDQMSPISSVDCSTIRLIAACAGVRLAALDGAGHIHVQLQRLVVRQVRHQAVLGAPGQDLGDEVVQLGKHGVAGGLEHGGVEFDVEPEEFVVVPALARRPEPCRQGDEVAAGVPGGAARRRGGRPGVRWRRGVRSGPAAAPAAWRRPAASGSPADRRRSRILPAAPPCPAAVAIPACPWRRAPGWLPGPRSGRRCAAPQARPGAGSSAAPGSPRQ